MGIKEKSSEIRYLTHMIVFPDGDTLIEQKQFIHDLQFEGRNWLVSVFHHQNNPRIRVEELINKGETRCESKYPAGGYIKHIYTIEEKERPTGWLVNK